MMYAWFWAEHDWEPHEILLAFTTLEAAREFLPDVVEQEIRDAFPQCALYVDEVQVHQPGTLRATLLSRVPHPQERSLYLGKTKIERDQYLTIVDTTDASPHAEAAHDESGDACLTHRPHPDVQRLMIE
jgi:hypothetical protein